MNRCFAILMAVSLCAVSEADAQNGGTSCETATQLLPQAFTADTTAAPNWMTSFGPLVSPSNDVVYTSVATPGMSRFIMPVASDYAFAMYLIDNCSNSGAEPTPIGATATIGTGIDVSGLTIGNAYFVVVTGTAAGGPGANGHLTFNSPFPVTLQSFDVE